MSALFLLTQPCQHPHPAFHGDIHALERLREKTKAAAKVWDAKVCGAAAMNGKLEVLKWLLSQKPPVKVWGFA